MDGYTGKRSVNGLVVPGKGSGLVLEDNVNSRERNAQHCNRIGCNGRLNYVKGTPNSSLEKAKSSKPSYRTLSTGKEIIGSSSRKYSAVNNNRKSSTKPLKKLSSQMGSDSSETSSVEDEPEMSEFISPPGRIQSDQQPESEDADSSEVTVTEAGSSRVAWSARSRRNLIQRSGLGKQDNLSSPSITLSSQSTNQATHANATRYGFRNLRCNSISDVVTSGCSSSDTSFSRRKDTVKKRNPEGESSSSTRGKKFSGSNLEGRNDSSNSGISISDSRTRNWLPNRESGINPVRSQRSSSNYGRGRLPTQANGNSLPLNESPVAIPQVSQPDLHIDLNAPLTSETASTRTSSYGRAGSITEGLRSIMPSSPSEAGITRSSMNRDSFRRYNMDGIAEVLLALERIEQDEELSYEQLLVLETSLFLNGLNFYDQHRDMRLDIDSMSYEELLALEERMGSVSTALSEEALSKCIKKNFYEASPLENINVGCEGEKDDVKCSICQEEYVIGDEVGRLQCEHRYHMACVQQWLRVKNWCPICKASAESEQSSLVPS